MSNASADHDVHRERAALYALGALTGGERAAFEAHLKTCFECAADVAAGAQVALALNQSVPQHDPPAALRGRVLTAVTGEGPSSRAPSRAVVVPLPPRTSARASLAPWLSLAAALVLVAGLAVYTASLRTQVSDLEGRLISAVARIDESARQAEEATRIAQAAQAPLPVLTAPDLARIDLAGQSPAAPSASARAYWSRSRGLVLTASNLPAPPAGKTYQLWVVPAAPAAPISVGLLKPDATGLVNIVFNTPPDILQPTAIALTDEPETGSPGPTGDKYLVGLAH